MTVNTARPRKKPQQARSRETFDAIVKASARILTEQGYDNLSTNRIARTAGVSPGSLYQYFPNKEAIIAALLDSLLDRFGTILQKRLAEVMNEPLETAAHKMMRALVEMLATVQPRLVRNLVEQVPRVGRRGMIGAVRQRGKDLARMYLGAHRTELRITDIDLAAFFVTSLAENLTFRIVFDRPRHLSAEYCADEAADLIVRYLAK
ncbi:MAG: TetR/AcrR family transcriptional regulator [Deltaproteobacteria bacterium]|nr:TetR/AcrR family transcriptional regulator [Deltaproteobacteria bacterium]